MNMGEYAGGYQLAYENAIAAGDPALAQTISQTQIPGESYINAALRVAQSVVLADSQRRLLNAQLSRAQQGLPPLDASQYGLGVNLGLSPDTLKLVGFGLLGLAAVFYLSRGR